MKSIPSWGWALLAVLALAVAYKRGMLGSFGFAPTAEQVAAKPPPPVPAAGTNALDIINSAVTGIFGLAKNLTTPDTGVKTT